jgi:hypothetical protein
VNVQQHDENWLRYFAATGYPDARPLAAGMEGAVYALTDDLVAKVWGGRSEAELERLRLFYDDLARARLTFDTPRIERILQLDGRFATIEHRLRGVPLADLEPRPAPHRPGWPAAVRCMLDVLEQLAAVADSRALRGLAVLDEPDPFWAGRAGWPDTLAALITRRLAEFGDQLRAAVPGFDDMARRLLELVAALPADRLGLMHGDLIPGNVLVDDAVRPVGVLDFGFLSTIGDPVFDAAVTASIFDMYGPAARAVEGSIDAAIAERLGHPADRMTLYRAAYGAITSNAYDPGGQDGHFHWCADIFRRADVRELLGGPVAAAHGTRP